jgi:hypothetical protein
MYNALSGKYKQACGVVYGIAASLEAEHHDPQAMALYDAVHTIEAFFEFLEREREDCGDE